MRAGTTKSYFEINSDYNQAMIKQRVILSALSPFRDQLLLLSTKGIKVV